MRMGWILTAVLMSTVALTGCCGGSKSSDSGASSTESTASSKAKLGERFKGPGSEFSVVVDKIVVTDAIGDTKPLAADSKWVVVYYKIKNEGKEPKNYMLEFKETMKDKAGGKYEPSTDGQLALSIKEPDSSQATLDKIPVGTELKQTIVYAVPGEKAKGELDLVFEELISIGAPKGVTLSFTATPAQLGDSKAPAPKPAPAKK